MTKYCRTGFTIGGAVSLMLVGTACDSERSSSPLSPQIAGPIAGVTITSPAAAPTLDGQLLTVTSQPVSLAFTNATSDSVRPFVYEIQIATDAAFTQIVLTQGDIQPTSDRQVTFQIALTLEPGVYYWRVRALDGANTGPYSATTSFELYTPVVVAAPTVISPTDGQVTPGNDTALVVQNAVITGPATGIQYQFQLAIVPGFAPLSALLTEPKGAGTSTTVGSGALPYDQVFYWRARVSAQSRVGEVVGPWTDTAIFRTPVPPVVIAVPIPSSPINGATTPSVRPTLVATNGSVTGSAGTVTYRFEVDEGTSFGNPTAVVVVPRSGSGTTSATLTADLESGQDYFWRVNGSNGTITSAWSAPQSFLTPTVSSPPSPPPDSGSGPRTPDPAPGSKLPLPDQSALIFTVAAENPGALANSCIEEGGSWLFMDLAVAALRATDTRWGYNCKRGNCNDPSVDVVDYFYGIGSGDQSSEVYLIDIISAVCPGGNQAPSWTDQTEATAEEGTIGRFIYPRP
jgi:hypothetical protein